MTIVGNVSDYFSPEGFDHDYRGPEKSSVYPGFKRLPIVSLFNKLVTIKSVTWLRSDDRLNRSFQLNGRPVFAVILVKPVTSRGKALTYSTHTGSIKVCQKLNSLMLQDAFPVKGTFVQHGDEYDLV